MKSSINSQVESFITALQKGQEAEASELEGELKSAVDDVENLQKALQIIRMDPNNPLLRGNLYATIKNATVAIATINTDGGDVDINVPASDKPDSTLCRYRRELADTTIGRPAST